jgi:hypothetical protein
LDPHLLDRSGDPFRFIGLQGARRTNRNSAKSTISGTPVAHQQEGGGPLGETFALVGTSGFLANGMQGALLNKPFYPKELRPAGHPFFQPGRLGLKTTSVF